MKTIEKLKGISFMAASLGSLLAIFLIGGVDYFLPPEVFTSVFYVLPIMLAGWTGVRWLGIFMALLSGIFWLLTDISAGHVYPHPAILPWNTLARFTTFLIVALLATSFRKALDKEELLADTDGLTGAINLRRFREKLAEEYERSTRYGRCFTLACLDVDNFKQVNDTMGHQVGDQLLVMVVEVLRSSLRRTDLVARQGGDEFAVLLPETAAAEAREAIVHAIAALQRAVGQRGWPVSFSVGVVSFVKFPENIDRIMKIADELMYNVKRGKKDDIAYRTWDRDESAGRGSRSE